MHPDRATAVGTYEMQLLSSLDVEQLVRFDLTDGTRVTITKQGVSYSTTRATNATVPPPAAPTFVDAAGRSFLPVSLTAPISGMTVVFTVLPMATIESASIRMLWREVCPGNQVRCDGPTCQAGKLRLARLDGRSCLRFGPGRDVALGTSGRVTCVVGMPPQVNFAMGTCSEPYPYACDGDWVTDTCVEPPTYDAPSRWAALARNACPAL